MAYFQFQIKEVLQSIFHADVAVRSLKDFISKLDNCFAVFKIKQPYVDMRGGEEEIRTAIGLHFWSTAIFGVLALIVAALSDIFVLAKILIIFIDVLGFAFKCAISLVICALLIRLVSYYSGAWSGTVAKIIAVLFVIGAVSSLFGIIGGIFGIIANLISKDMQFADWLLSIIKNIFFLIENVVGVVINISALNGLNKGIGYNS